MNKSQKIRDTIVAVKMLLYELEGLRDIMEEEERNIINAEAELSEFIDRELYLPVKQELESCGVYHSLGVRKENLKTKIKKVLSGNEK